MRTDKLIDQLELYSNAVVGFLVAQSIGFAITFGTNAAFGCEITKYKPLALGLVLHFILTTLLGGFAVAYLGRKISDLSGENKAVVVTVFRVKVGILVLFAALPIALLLAFGFAGDVKQGRCAPSEGPPVLKAPR